MIETVRANWVLNAITSPPLTFGLIESIDNQCGVGEVRRYGMAIDIGSRTRGVINEQLTTM